MTLWLFSTALVYLLPLFQPGTSGYDFINHTASLAQFYQGLAEGNLLPRWAGTINFGYGHPMLIFANTFVYYLGSLFHWLGFSLVDSVKLVNATGFISSGILAYLVVSKLWGRLPGIAAGFIYLLSPYRIINLYDRAALGEQVASSLLFLYLYLLVTRKSVFWQSLALGLTLMAHNLIFVLSLPVIAAVTFHRKVSLKLLLVSAILGIGLSAFTWLPATLERKYTFYDTVTTPAFYASRPLPLSQLLVSANYFKFPEATALMGQYLYYNISPVQWLIFITGVFLAIKRRSWFIGSLCTIFFIGVFMTSSTSLFLLKFIPQLAFFQYSFRFLNLPLYVSPFLAGYIISRRPALSGWIIIAVIASSIIYLHDTDNIPRQYLADNYFTAQLQPIRESSSLSPRWGPLSQEVPAEFPVQAASGHIESSEIDVWRSHRHRYAVNLPVDSQIVDNTVYFPGWQVTVDGQPAPITFQDTNWSGLITYPVPAGLHQIEVKFTNTRLRLFANFISLTSLAVLLVSLFITRVHPKQHTRPAGNP